MSPEGYTPPYLVLHGGIGKLEKSRMPESSGKSLPRILHPCKSSKSYEEALISIDIESIEIDVPPRCPHCKTKLEEKQRFLGGYKWICVGCDFSKNNKDSFYKEEDRAKMRAEASMEKRFRIKDL